MVALKLCFHESFQFVFCQIFFSTQLSHCYLRFEISLSSTHFCFSYTGTSSVHRRLVYFLLFSLSMLSAISVISTAQNLSSYHFLLLKRSVSSETSLSINFKIGSDCINSFKFLPARKFLFRINLPSHNTKSSLCPTCPYFSTSSSRDFSFLHDSLFSLLVGFKDVLVYMKKHGHLGLPT